MTEIDCEMLDKAVNHHRSADPGPARGDQAGSVPTSSAFLKSLLRVTHKMFMIITYITCFCHSFGNTTVYTFLLSREYFIIYDRKQ